MKNTNLLGILKEKNRNKYEQFLQTSDMAKVTAEEELEFFKTAPEDWLADYISVTYPQIASERVLMVTANVEVLKKAYDMWGFWDENIKWLFMSATHNVCIKVLSCMTDNPGYGAEMLMIKRNSRELLQLWLEKFSGLSEDAERLLHEDNSLQELKSLYIEKMITGSY